MTNKKNSVNWHRHIVDMPASIAEQLITLGKTHGCDISHIVTMILDANLHNMNYDKMERHLDLLQEKWFGDKKYERKWRGKTKKSKTGRKKNAA